MGVEQIRLLEFTTGKYCVVEYDDTMFEPGLYMELPVLKCKRNFIGKVKRPEGLTTTMGMFANLNLANIDFSEFDMTGVVNATGMFERATFPDKFRFPDCFKTDSVIGMSSIFRSATFGKEFSLGNGFTTKNTKYLSYAFADTSLPEGFTLGENFVTDNSTDATWMFKESKLNTDFNLGAAFRENDIEQILDYFPMCDLNIVEEAASRRY